MNKTTQKELAVSPLRQRSAGLPANWIAADIVRIENGMLTEHWDVIEDEVTKQESQSGLPMFGEEFSK